MSEMFKIIQVVEFGSELSTGDQVYARVLGFLRDCYVHTCALRVAKKLDSEMESLTRIVSLMCTRNDDGRKSMGEKIHLNGDNKRMLAINLRNTLLASLAFAQVDKSRLEKRLDALKFLKNSFECCRFYLDRVSSEFEPDLGEKTKKANGAHGGVEIVNTRKGKF